jgi:hypothetical protein
MSGHITLLSLWACGMHRDSVTFAYGHVAHFTKSVFMYVMNEGSGTLVA